MKRWMMPVLAIAIVTLSFGCNVQRFGGYTLNERDAATAVRQMLEIGTKEGLSSNAFSKDAILSALFPESVKKTLNTLQQLGFTNEIDRFTTTLSTAANKTATASVPIFVSGINNMNITDAMRIIKNGGTSATDYLRSSVGDSVRHSIKPIMQASLDEYKLNEKWNDIIRPVKGIAGNRLNLDLTNLMAGVVSEAMFQKLEEKERQIRSEKAARTTPMLQKVFSRNWN